MRQQGGFTLIEVLVAVTVAALVLLSAYGVVAGVGSVRERLETEGEGYHRARVIFDRLGREIRGAYLSPRPETPTPFTAGKDERGNPFLTFATTAGTPAGGGRGGLAVVRYQLADDPEPGSSGKVLLRSERPLFVPEAAPASRLAAGVEQMRVRFFADGSWREQWQEGLPQLVEVSLTMTAGRTAVPFLSTFELPDVQAQP
jgi:general secretion pathway protein J